MTFTFVARHLLSLLAWVLAVGAANVSAAESIGEPPLTRIPINADVFPQHFALAQDEQSVLYLGGLSGLLIYDGERWEPLAIDGDEAVRALAADQNGRVYVGSYDHFGYLSRDASGREVFTDLSPRFASLLDGERFADIWSIQISPEGVFFVGLHHLALFDPQTDNIRLWRHPGRFGAIARVGEQTILQFRGEGLRRFDGREWQPLPGSAALGELAHTLVPTPGGGLLATGSDGKWREYRDGQVVQRTLPAGTPAAADINGILPLADGSLAMAGADGKLHLVDLQHQQHRSIRVSRSSLWTLIPARDGGLLIETDLEIYHLRWPSRWSIIGEAEQLQGYIFKLVEWQGQRYALGLNGVQRMPAAGESSVRRLDWTSNEAWDLLPISATQALLAESYDLLLIDGDRRRSLCTPNCYPRQVQQSRHDPQIYLVGTEYGLMLLRKDQAGWTQLRAIEQAPTEVFSIDEIAAGDYLLGTDREGLVHLQLSADLRTTVLREAMVGAAQGLNYGDDVWAETDRLPDGRLRAMTQAGYFIRDAGGSWVAESYDQLPRPNADEPVSVVDLPGGGRLAWDSRHVFAWDPSSGWQDLHVTRMLRGALQPPLVNPDGSVIWGMMDSLLRYDPQIDEPAPAVPPLLLRSVELLHSDGRIERVALDSPLRRKRGNYTLRMRYALPDYSAGSSGVSYQVRVDGIHTDYSDWRSNSEISLNSMDAAEYRLNIRARTPDGRITEPLSFEFSILPPWYESGPLQAVYAVLAVMATLGLAAAIAALRTHRLSAERQRLSALVDLHTRELKQANSRLQDLANRDGLTDVANRRHLDQFLAQAWQWCMEQHRPLGVLLIDVDNFKQINDSIGHLAGDDLLRILGKLLQRGCRSNRDLAARYGGDEFVVVLPDISLEQARELAEQLRQWVHAEAQALTVSIGLAVLRPRAGESPSRVIEEADAALYRAKREGRDRVVAA